MTSKYQTVVINHSKPPLPATLSKQKTKDGRFRSLGAFTDRSTKWRKVQDRIWPATFDDNEMLGIEEFKSKYYGALRAAGFPHRYAIKMVADSSIENGVEWPGVITLR